jgi:hypothetical protein
MDEDVDPEPVGIEDDRRVVGLQSPAARPTAGATYQRRIGLEVAGQGQRDRARTRDLRQPRDNGFGIGEREPARGERGHGDIDVLAQEEDVDQCRLGRAQILEPGRYAGAEQTCGRLGGGPGDQMGREDQAGPGDREPDARRGAGRGGQRSRSVRPAEAGSSTLTAHVIRA